MTIQVASGVQHVPDGALITDPGVARRCLRCKHLECPCCNDFCDECVFLERDDSEQMTYREEGDMVFVRYRPDMEMGDEEYGKHRVCNDEGRCAYDREEHPDALAVQTMARERWNNSGGAFGVTEDGRVWFAGPDAEARPDRHGGSS